MMHEKKNSHTAILICSYDGAEDLWKPLSQTYKTYWKDCPYKIYLGTNHKKPKLPPFTPLTIGNELSWSDNILKCLERIKEKNVLIIFDDVFLYKKIDTRLITEFTDIAYEHQWSYLRLSPDPHFDKRFRGSIGKIFPNRLYRTSTAWAIFKKKVLIDLLDPKESAWDFEILGSHRSNKYSDFYSIDTTVLPYLNGVVKGKWVRKVFYYLKANGFSVSEEDIRLMSHWENISFQAIRLRSFLFSKIIPKSIQLKLRTKFHK